MQFDRDGFKSGWYYDLLCLSKGKLAFNRTCILRLFSETFESNNQWNKQSIFVTMSYTGKIRLVSRQDHTSHCHFCSMIDEFPVWNSELIKPWWWVRRFLLSVKRCHSSQGQIDTLMIASFLKVSLWRKCCLSGQIYIYLETFQVAQLVYFVLMYP